MEIELKPLQVEMINELRKAMVKSKRVILQAATGVGKTVISAAITKSALEKGKKVLFIVDRIILANQTSDMFMNYGIPHGVIQAQNDRFDIGQPCQIASIQTVKRRGCNAADLIIIDECFHGDTEISTPSGNKKIKFVMPGDLVYNAYGVGEVRKICVSKNKLMKVSLSNGESISCTKGHPFFTNSGWKTAGKLDVGERLFGKKDLSDMQEVFSSDSHNVTKWKGKSYPVRKKLEINRNLLKLLCEEIEESNERQPGSKRKAKVGDGWSQNRGTGRKWRCKYFSREFMFRVGRWVCDRIYSANSNKRGGPSGCSVSLQNRYCKPNADDCDRGRRKLSPNGEKKATRRQKGLFAPGIRVESITIEPCRGEDIVYNLEVSRHPSYFAGGVLVHNCHVLHKAHKDILSNNPNSYIVGLTATPYAKELGKYFDHYIRPFSPQELVKENYLVPFDVFGPTIADLKKLKVVAGEFSEESQSETFDKVDIIGNVVKTWKKLTPGRKTIVFGVNVAHIKNLVDQFRAAGIMATQINAYQPDWERKEALDGYLNGLTTVLCSVEAAVKGFDSPDTEICCLAVATRSMIKLTQTVGRALRTFPGKEKAVILDFGGNFERLGFPDQFDFFALDDGSKPKAGERKKRERLPKVCPSCDFVKPVGVRTCPACGFTPDFKEDVEVAEGELKKLQRKEVREYTIAQKQSFLAQLTQYAADHNMKRGKNGCYGWALHKYKDKFGVWPSGKIDWSRREPVGEEVSRYITYQNIRYAKRRII